jgi:hypothetical protein
MIDEIVTLLAKATTFPGQQRHNAAATLCMMYTGLSATAVCGLRCQQARYISTAKVVLIETETVANYCAVPELVQYIAEKRGLPTDLLFGTYTQSLSRFVREHMGVGTREVSLWRSLVPRSDQINTSGGYQFFDSRINDKNVCFSGVLK